MATDNLDIPDATASQNNKVTTLNEAHNFLDRAIANRLQKTVSDAGDTTLDTSAGGEALGNVWYEFTGALTAGRNVVVPTNTKLYLVRNDTTGGFNVTVKTSAGTGPAIRPGEKALLFCDGTDVVVIWRSLDHVSGQITDVLSAQVYVLVQSAPFPFDIVSITHQLRVGTDITFDLEIDGVDVTGIAAQTATTSEATDAATGANSVPVGGRVTLNVTGITGSPEDFGFSMEIVRTD